MPALPRHPAQQFLPCIAFAFLALIAISLAAAGPLPRRLICDAELRSWVVFARGRHLYLDLKNLPAKHTHLAGRVEFTSANLRADYTPARRSGAGPALPRVARMTRGSHLRSPLAQPRDRLEQRYRLTLAQAEALQRDRLFAAPYELTGPNSNAALRRAMESAGLRLPGRIIESSGLLGEFPGIDANVGPEFGASQWREFGLPDGPSRTTSAPRRPAAARR